MSATKDEKQMFCDSFFENEVKPKHLANFEAVTPDNNTIYGVICKKPNRFLGSMVITHIKTKTNEFDTLQFVQAMPKIHYYSYNSELNSDAIYRHYDCYEKLDGSCIIFYPIFDNVNQLLEIVPKTRGVPVADTFIIDMLKLIDKKNIEEYFKDYPYSVLLFELYGFLNQHEIVYPKYYINLALLGVVQSNVFLFSVDVDVIAEQYHFERPDRLFYMTLYKGIWRVYPSLGVMRYYDNLNYDEEYATQLDAVNGIRDALTSINKNYYDEHGRSLTEGVVVNGFDSSNKQMFMKIKPWDIEEKCRTENGIPRKFINKEINKYFDEYGSQAKEIYKKDKAHSYNYIVNALSEEFSEDALNNPKTIHRIKKMFLDMLEAKEPPIGLQKLCSALVKEYPGYAVPDLMRIFAQEYPEKKKHSRMVFSILEKMI